ncbi:hypothetical protein NP590_14270 [Methylomonas sp. SURF-2]|uniref:Uncharacterized protein n=1 Tax=Methylomonas subterranea TaxID=2952225 RepID=A0ABT1TII2_9GAMM|nr:hypothetical protein [Methylomonas sp. SURF-2]MCQ8105277.1 hypothetical protein [Methylomonas sp. SURF-2]
MTIQISSMIPDRALDESALFKAITKVAIDLAGLATQAVQKKLPILNVVFMLPSRQEKADFEGLRLHSFDQSDQTLRIEAAVPEKMLDSRHAERYVLAILADAIDAAAEFFNEQRILFDAPAHFALVEVLAPKQQQAIH